MAYSLGKGRRFLHPGSLQGHLGGFLEEMFSLIVQSVIVTVQILHRTAHALMISEAPPWTSG